MEILQTGTCQKNNTEYTKIADGSVAKASISGT